MFHVIVVGAGPGGLMAAKVFQNRGIKVTVVERKPKEDLCADIGGAYDISGNTKKVFEAVGLQEEFNALGGVIKGFSMINGLNGDNFKQADVSRGFLAGLRRSEIQKVLMGSLQDESVLCGDPVISFEEKEQSVVVTLASGITIEGDLLIGADGIRSTVLRNLFPDEYEAKLRFTKAVSYWGFFDYDAETDSNVMLPEFGLSILAPGVMIGGGVHGEGKEAVWAAIVRKEEPEHSQEAPDQEKVKNEVLEIVKDYLPKTVPGFVRKTDPHKMFKTHIYDRDPLDCWHKGRCVLIGDAAHAMNPFAGQGANMAMIDGFLLSTLVCEQLNQNETMESKDLSQLFNKFESLRKPAATANLTQARKTMELTLNSGPFTSWCFRTIMRFLPSRILASALYKADEQNNEALIACGLEPCVVPFFGASNTESN